jgi:monoamine oxidase
MMTEHEATQWRLSQARYNAKERAFLARNAGANLGQLYLDPYGNRITDEYQPFGCGLDALDDLSLNQLLQRDGASAAAIGEIGSASSALHVIWKRRIVQMRRIPEEPTVFYRVKGGNQGLPDALAQRLGNSIRTNSPVLSIERGGKDTAVAVIVRNGQTTKRITADHLVCAMNAAMLRQIPVTPAWPEGKQFAISNVPYTVETRPIFQSRTKFWKKDGFSGNMQFDSPMLGPLWPTADEVETSRGIMIGTAQASVTADHAMSVFKRYYPGHSADFEKTLAVDWSRDPWAMGCEARDYQPGLLRKFWPVVIQPVGNVYFAGAYCDNQSWGMEAATRSGFRVARTIHEERTA